jgi:molecular chaperone GrpE
MSRRKSKTRSAPEAAGAVETEPVTPEQETGDPVSSTSEGSDRAVEASAGSSDPRAAEITRLEAEVAALKDKFLRSKAEQQNAQRRAENEVADAVRYANSGLLRGLLDVADDFERALEAAGQCESVQQVIDGVSLVRDKLTKFLDDQHVKVIDAEGTAFDPQQHEALMQQPTGEHAPGTVVQQVQRGYRLRDRVLRPAKVIVATAPPEAEDGGESAEE